VRELPDPKQIQPQPVIQQRTGTANQVSLSLLKKNEKLL